MIEPFDAYQKYLAIKLHFSQPSYDYFKYHGKTNARKDKFNLRQDRFFFHKLSKKENLELYLACNFMENPELWAGQLLEQECIDRYKETLKRHQSLEYLFKNDLSQFDSLDEAFTVRSGDYPKILNMFNRREIMAETMVILNGTCNMFHYWDSCISDTILWPKIRDKLIKYGSFISYDKEKYNDVIKNLI